MRLGIIGTKTLVGTYVEGVIELAMSHLGATEIATFANTTGVAETASIYAVDHGIVNTVFSYPRDVPAIGMPQKRAEMLFEHCDHVLFINDGYSEELSKLIDLAARKDIKHTVEVIDYHARYSFFIACPYYSKQSKKREERRQLAIRYTNQCLKNGMVAYCPLAHSIPFEGIKEHMWQKHGEIMASRMDVLIVLALEGWQQSEGVRREINSYRQAHPNGIVQYKTVKDIYNFTATK